MGHGAEKAMASTKNAAMVCQQTSIQNGLGLRRRSLKSLSDISPRKPATVRVAAKRNSIGSGAAKDVNQEYEWSRSQATSKYHPTPDSRDKRSSRSLGSLFKCACSLAGKWELGLS
jgi:hypothetical protein